MSEISYPFGGLLPETATTMEVVPGVKWLRMPLPFALNHINLWLIEDEAGWCAVDTGLTTGESKQAWNTLLASHPLARLLVTHYHPDHLGLAGWLQQKTGAPLWMTQGEYVYAQVLLNGCGNFSVDCMVELFRQHGLDQRRLNALKLRGNVYREGFPIVPPTFQRLFDNQEVKIGKHQWRVIVGYGHAVEHVSLYCAELGLLISGDMLLPTISTNVPVVAANPLGNPLQYFLDSIQRYRELPADTLVLPSHGRPFRGMHARIDALEAHHEKRCGMLLAAARTPKTACELLPALFDRDITDPHQSMFAMSEAIAHINYLEALGKLQRHIDTEHGIARFSAI